jgi:hypothetical protein
MRKYVILNASEVGNINFNQVLQTSADTLRYSLDGSKFLVKFYGDTPGFLLGEPQYTKEEILPILAGADWTPED